MFRDFTMQFEPSRTAPDLAAGAMKLYSHSGSQWVGLVLLWMRGHGVFALEKID